MYSRQMQYTCALELVLLLESFLLAAGARSLKRTGVTRLNFSGATELDQKHDEILDLVMWEMVVLAKS